MVRRLLAALALALALLLPMVAGQHADGADGTDQEEEVAQDWSEETRTVAAVEDALGFHFESERRTDLGRDQLLGQFDTARARLTYEYVSTEPGNETILRLHLDFVALVEFEDVDRDGRFGFADTTVRRIPLNDRPGAALANPPVCLPDGDCTVTVVIPINASQEPAPLPIENAPVNLGGRLELTFHILSQKRVLGSSVVLPTQTKFDIRIEDFPYSDDSGGNETRLALETRLSSNQALEPAAGQVRTPTRPFVALYGWTGQGAALGTSVPVGVTLIHDANAGTTDAGDQSVTVVYSYPPADDIRHDPSVGVMRYRPLAGPADIVEAFFKGDWRIYGTAFILAMSVVAASAAYRLRRG